MSLYIHLLPLYLQYFIYLVRLSNYTILEVIFD